MAVSTSRAVAGGGAEGLPDLQVIGLRRVPGRGRGTLSLGRADGQVQIVLRKAGGIGDWARPNYGRKGDVQAFAMPRPVPGTAVRRPPR